jgi:hypothetical protein
MFIRQNYEWRCKVCESANVPGGGFCSRCGNDAYISPNDVDAARQKLGMPPDPEDALVDLKRVISPFSAIQIVVGTLAVLLVVIGGMILQQGGDKIIGLGLVIAGLAAVVSFPPDRDKK